MQIVLMKLISNSDGVQFYNQLNSTIINFQNQGAILEIQYSYTGHYFTALVLGRKPEEKA